MEAEGRDSWSSMVWAGTMKGRPSDPEASASLGEVGRGLSLTAPGPLAVASDGVVTRELHCPTSHLRRVPLLLQRAALDPAPMQAPGCGICPLAVGVGLFENTLQHHGGAHL